VDDPTTWLHRERDEARARLAGLSGALDDVVAASLDSNADDEHDPEGATIAFERSQVQSLIERAHARVREVDAALARLEAGTYGTCERCGRPVAPARLRARPTARTCVGCAS
jgi:DnaK suppressor protein